MITAEAIEAGARALKPSAWDDRVNWGTEGSRKSEQDYYKAIARTVLAAAVGQVMLAAVWDEGEAAGQDNADAARGHDVEHKRNPYRRADAV